MQLVSHHESFTLDSQDRPWALEKLGREAVLHQSEFQVGSGLDLEAL